MSPRAEPGRAGFTLVELMVAMLAGAILAMLVGTILVAGWSTWRKNSETVDLQRDASLAMSVVGRLVRAAPIDEDGAALVSASDDGDILYIGAGGVTNVAWVGDKLVWAPSGMELVSSGVLNFAVRSPRSDGAWDIVLQLYDADSGGDIIMTGTYAPRNAL